MNTQTRKSFADDRAQEFASTFRGVNTADERRMRAQMARTAQARRKPRGIVANILAMFTGA